MATIRLLIGLEAASLAIASLLHSGVVTGGPLDQAAYYEGTIAVVLAAALALAVARPGWTRGIALVSQGFALAGACIGLFATLRGFGPNSPLDVVYHVALITLLVVGLWTAWRLRAT
jgi:hypothetical protein